MRVKVQLSADWEQFQRQLQALTQGQAELALAIATTKTAKDIGTRANELMGSKEFSKAGLVKVTTMARPSQNSIQAVVGYRRAKLFRIPSWHKSAKVFGTGVMMALMRAKSGGQSPAALLKQKGVFVMPTRAGFSQDDRFSMEGSSHQRTGKALAIIARRRGAHSLSGVDALARVYPVPSQDLASIANQVAPASFARHMRQQLAAALRRARSASR